MQQEITSFQQEYLAELEIAEAQLLALAGAVPEGSYGWRPVLGARPFSAVLSTHRCGESSALVSCRRADTPCQTPRFLSRQR